MATPVVWLPLNGDWRNIGTSANSAVWSAGSNCSWIDGKLGQCLRMNSGTSSNMTINELKGSKQISIAYWLKCNTATSTQWLDPIHFYSTDGSTRYVSRQELYSNCTLIGYWYKGGSISGVSFPVGEWHHMAITIDYNSGQAKMYKDGTQVGSTTNVDTTNYVDGLDIRLGESGLDLCESDVRIYNTILSAKEVKEIAQGLILHYPLNETNYCGANLYTGSQDFSGSWINKSIWTTDTNQYNGFTVLKRSAIWGGLAQNINCVQNDIFTISFWAKMDSGGKLQSVHRSSLGNVTTGLTILSGNFTSSNVWVSESQNGTQWKRYWATLQITGSDITYLQWRIENSVADKNLYIAGMSLVKGYGPTSWTPNKNDVIYKDDLVYDASGFNHYGTLVGTPLITQINNNGRYAGSLNLNGTDQGIQFQSPDFNTFFNNIWTISFWIYSNGENGGRSIYFSSYNASPFWSLEKSAGNAIRYDWNGSPDQYGTSNKIMDDTWNHIVLVKYSNTSCKSYINGVLDKEMTTAVSALTLNNPIWRIGRDVRTGDGTPYKGNISDFRIYATALSETDIKALYNTSYSIDNLGQGHGYEYQENSDLISIQKNGIIKQDELNEIITLSDGSMWLPIMVHDNKSGTNLFSSSDDFTKLVYHNDDCWAEFPLINSAPRPDNSKYEFLVYQHPTDDANFQSVRWSQTSNPTTTTSVAGFTAITTGVTNTAGGGLCKCSGNTYMAVSNSTGNWWNACGNWTNYNNGSPGWLSTVIKRELLLFMRVSSNNYRDIKNSFVIGTSFLEI